MVKDLGYQIKQQHISLQNELKHFNVQQQEIEIRQAILTHKHSQNKETMATVKRGHVNA